MSLGGSFKMKEIDTLRKYAELLLSRKQITKDNFVVITAFLHNYKQWSELAKEFAKSKEDEK